MDGELFRVLLTILGWIAVVAVGSTIICLALLQFIAWIYYSIKNHDWENK